jgi:membrane-bound serine protease (ClpP class)
MLYRKKIMCYVLCLFVCAGVQSSAFANTSAARADIITIDGGIGPATADYVSQSIAKSNADHSRVIILRIDTPGGLVSATREILKSMLSSKVPVVSLVTPGAAQAASAGTFIVYASSIAAMSEATNIGAASPISLTSTGDDSNTKTAQKKAMQALLANIRAMAQKNGRDVEWSQEAVKDAASITWKEAKSRNVINYIANDIPTLLNKINGVTVNLMSGPVKLDTAKLSLRELKPNWRIQFLMIITNPNVTYILLLAGLLGLAVELFNPGLIFPGVLGVVFLAVAAYGLAILPVNFVGLGLILLAVGFFTAEVFLSSYGALTVGGIVALTIGSIMLIRSDVPGFSLSALVIAVVVGFFALAFSGLVYLMVRDQVRPSRTGEEHWIGKVGTVTLKDDVYWLKCESQLFRIDNSDGLTDGQQVTIERLKGARVIVH